MSALSTMPKPLTLWITINCGKFFRRWEYWTTFPTSWEIYMQVKKLHRMGHGTTDWFKIGKGVWQGCILLPSLFNLYPEYIMWNVGLDESQAGIKIIRKKFQQHQLCRYYPNGRKLKGSKEPLDESEKGEWKSWLKTQHLKNQDHGIWSHHFMTSRQGKSRSSHRVYVLGLQNHCVWWLQPWN